ncbi:hypothetical protein V7165_09495, partial [Priestia megaterium]|uniref:hypothetical protein n=5 Tax=Priestia megaterium TaxID=1404 RepID=UPI0030087658
VINVFCTIFYFKFAVGEYIVSSRTNGVLLPFVNNFLYKVKAFTRHILYTKKRPVFEENKILGWKITRSRYNDRRR